MLENAVQHLKRIFSDEWKSDAALFSYSLFLPLLTKKCKETQNESGRATSFVSFSWRME